MQTPCPLPVQEMCPTVGHISCSLDEKPLGDRGTVLLSWQRPREVMIFYQIAK